MDLELARTFLECVHQGSFVRAADRLSLTQTAVSARIRTLEELLGRRLFIRNKAGAKLTPAGERFKADATTLMQVWQRAQQRIALPAGKENVVSLGGELSLWNPLITRWLVWMRQNAPQIALRAEIDSSHRLLERLHDGSLDVGVVYNPPPQSDLVVELLVEEKLVLATTDPRLTLDAERYVHVDWGPAFTPGQQSARPSFSVPAVTISLGPLALSYLLEVGGAGYFRHSAIAPYLANQRLHLVEQAPEFSYSIHAVYSTRVEADLLGRIRAGMRAAAQWRM